jgi:hypothetical protein
MSNMYRFDGTALATVESPASRPLRWAAWRPDGAAALLVGNRGEAYRHNGRTFIRVDTGSPHNLRGVAWSPQGEAALLVGNRGAVLLYDGVHVRELSSPTVENLRRVAWAPDGVSALIIGNAGVVLRYDAASGALQALPGDRAHTLRSIAWRPDGAYALIGGYASRYAGYPRPHVLYRCDGRYTQALLATDDEDDAVAIDWRPGASPQAALALIVSYDGDTAHNKVVTYDGSHLRSVAVGVPGTALLGAAWCPDGAYALLCGEHGALMRWDGAATAIATSTRDNLIGPFWHPGGSSALLLKGPEEKVYTA